MSETISQMKSS